MSSRKSMFFCMVAALLQLEGKPLATRILGLCPWKMNMCIFLSKRHVLENQNQHLQAFFQRKWMFLYLATYIIASIPWMVRSRPAPTGIQQSLVGARGAGLLRQLGDHGVLSKHRGWMSSKVAGGVVFPQE